MAYTDDRLALGRRLTAARAESRLPLRLVERKLWLLLGDYSPSAETLRRYHNGEVGPDRADPLVIAGLADIYGVTVAELSPFLSERMANVITLATRVTAKKAPKRRSAAKSRTRWNTHPSPARPEARRATA